MARAKDTSRADARRRHRAERSATLIDHDAEAADEAIAAEEAAAEPRRRLFRPPDILGDIRAFPRMFLERKLLFLPFILVVATFLAGLAAFRGLIPAGTPNDLAVTLVNLILPPQALLAYFLAGFLAPRGSYLVGLLMGLLTAPLYGVLIFQNPAPAAQQQVAGLTLAGILPQLLLQGILFGTLGAAFASWYRSFLRSTQERSRQARVVREQQARLRAKEQERKDRDAAREARRSPQRPAGKPST